MKKIVLVMLLILLVSSFFYGSEKQNKENHFYDTLYRIKIKDKYGYIDSDGNMIIHPKYEKAYSFSEGLASVSDSEGLHIINTKGEVLFSSTDFSFIGEFSSNGLAYVIYPYSQNKCGYMNRDFKIVFEFSCRSAENFNDGFACIGVLPDGYYHFINDKGFTVFSLNMDDTSKFVDGFAIVKLKKGKTYERKIINNKGEFISIPTGYELYGFTISNGYVSLKKGSTSALWNLKENIVIDAPEGYVFFMCNYGFITVMETKTELFGLMDASKNLVIPCKYDDIGILSENLLLFSESGNYGLMEISGNIIIPPQFGAIGDIVDNMIYINPRNGYDGGYLCFDGKVFYAENYFRFYDDVNN